VSRAQASKPSGVRYALSGTVNNPFVGAFSLDSEGVQYCDGVSIMYKMTHSDLTFAKICFKHISNWDPFQSAKKSGEKEVIQEIAPPQK
jgi:hypothetical protein